jgi:AcrR family transcriptional regulator
MARPRTDIRLRILHAARASFLGEGVDGASLRRIARGARTNIGMIYYYFPTKEELFLEVVEEVYAKLLGDLGTALARDVSIEERCHRLFVRFGAMGDDELEVVRLVIREILVSSDRRRRLLQRFLGGHIPLVVSTLVEGVQAGTIRSDPHPAVLGISMLCLGTFAQVIRRLMPVLPPELPLPAGEDFSHALADVLFSGIRAPG